MVVGLNKNLLCLTYASLFCLIFKQKYPIVWQGLLALKNDTAAVQLHFVCGNKALAHRSLPLQEGGALLRIVQRMRLEASQLESVARRMTVCFFFCLTPIESFFIKWSLLTTLALFPSTGGQ